MTPFHITIRYSDMVTILASFPGPTPKPCVWGRSLGIRLDYTCIKQTLKLSDL